MFMVAGFIMIYITSWSSGFWGPGIAVGLILTLILTVVLGVMIEKGGL